MGDKPSKKENELNKKVEEKRLEAKKFNFPSTFMEWAKLSREANKLEASLEILKDERLQAQKKPLAKGIKSVLKYFPYAAMFFLYFNSEIFCDSEDGLIQFESHSFMPFSRLFSFGLSTNPNFIAIGPVGWSVICHRVISNILP